MTDPERRTPPNPPRAPRTRATTTGGQTPHPQDPAEGEDPADARAPPGA